MREHSRTDESSAPVRHDQGADVRRAGDAEVRAAGNQALSRLLDAEGHDVPPQLRAQVERRLGEDLGHVRVHAGADASAAAGALDAVAFTRGEDVVLGAGAPPPSSAAGEELLAHELAHVVQQRRATHLVEGVSEPGDATERAAEAVAHGSEAPTSGGPVSAVQRQPAPGKEQRPVGRAEVEAALRDYLEQVLHDQGRQTIEKTQPVIDAITSLFADDPVRSGSVERWLRGITDGSPAGLARDVARQLPDVIPESRLTKIGGKPKKQTPDTKPKNIGDAAAAPVVDSTVAPLVKGLGLSKDKQDKVIEAARGAVASGAIGVLDSALDAVGVAGQGKSAIHAAVEAALKQQPGKAMDRQQEGAGSPDRKDPPPSVAPAPPVAPDTHIFSAPPLKWDFPGVKPPPKRPAPLPKINAAVEQAAAAVDPNVMIPPEVRGTKAADSFAATGYEFAINIARLLDEAQTKKNNQVNLELGAPYATVKDRAELMAGLKAVVLRMRDALPHQASLVGRVNFTINGRIAYSFSLHSGPD